MTIDGLLTCLYCLSACTFYLALKNIISLRLLNWKLAFNLSKILIYICFTIVLLISAHQLGKFSSADTRKPVITIEFKELTHQYFMATIVSTDNRHRFTIHGDMWQMDFKVLTWSTILSYFGLDPLYSIERLNGRYSSINNEMNKPRSIYNLTELSSSDVAWPYISRFLEVFLVRAYYGSSIFAPMADQAQFAIYLTDSGLELLAENQAAKESLKHWR